MTAKIKEKSVRKLTKGYRREYYEVDCPQCGGSGLIDHQAGLIRLNCRRCKGSGKIRRERRVPKGKPVKVKDDNDNEGTEPTLPGGPGQSTSESPVQEESRTGG